MIMNFQHNTKQNSKKKTNNFSFFIFFLKKKQKVTSANSGSISSAFIAPGTKPRTFTYE